MIIGTPSHMIVSEERVEQRLCHARTEIRTCYPQQINITRSHQEITKGSWGQTECSNRYGECKKRHISLGQNGREHMESLWLSGQSSARYARFYRAIRDCIQILDTFHSDSDEMLQD